MRLLMLLVLRLSRGEYPQMHTNESRKGEPSTGPKSKRNRNIGIAEFGTGECGFAEYQLAVWNVIDGASPQIARPR